MSDKAGTGAGAALGALRRAVTSPHLLISLTMLFWSSNVVLSRGLRADIPLVGLSFWRWSMAALLLLPFAYPHLRRQWGEAREQWKRLAILAFLIVVAGNTVLYVAVKHTAAINVAIVNGAQPVVTVFLAALVLREAVTRGQGLGIALSFLGILAIISRGQVAAFVGLGLNPGDLMMVAAVLSWALYAVLLKRWRLQLHPLVVLQAIMAFGALQVLPFYLWESAAQRPMNFDAVTVAMVLYTAVFASILAVLFWNIGNVAIGPNRAAIYVNLIPVYTTVAAVAFLGEAVEAHHVAGFALIFTGIFLMARGR
jgi:drug/metabolite transporter (DMT)-like permease